MRQAGDYRDMLMITEGQAADAINAAENFISAIYEKLAEEGNKYLIREAKKQSISKAAICFLYSPPAATYHQAGSLFALLLLEARDPSKHHAAKSPYINQSRPVICCRVSRFFFSFPYQPYPSCFLLPSQPLFSSPLSLASPLSPPLSRRTAPRISPA